MTDETAVVESPSRSNIADELKWDLTTIFKTDADWEAAFTKLKDALPRLSAFKGRMKRSGKTLLKAYQLRDELGLILEHLFVYAKMRQDEDTTNTIYKAMADRIDTLNKDYATACAYMAPEVLSLAQDKLDRFVAKVDGLTLYKQELAELSRTRPHVRNSEVEEVLAATSELQSAAGVRKQLVEADMRFPGIIDPRGRLVELTDENYGDVFLDSHDRRMRQQGYEAMMGTLGKFRNTFGALYAAQVKGNQFHAQSRNYGSCLEAALKPHDLPTSMYHTLIETVGANLPKLNRYLQTKKRLLKLDQMHMYDLYVPVIQGVEDKYSWGEAQEIVCKALAVLGEDYVNTIRAGIAARWIDVMPNKGKNTGAYSWGAYGTNPFVLLNWHGNLGNVMTLGHELGHSMHSLLTRKTQPYPYGSYTLFLAEVASTCNEALMRHYLLNTVTDKKVRQFVLNSALEDFRTTLFRQTLFAEFELEAHTLAEKGEALTPDVLCGIHKRLNEKYYGASCVVDELIGNEWMRIPHFFDSFYVYQYATGISSATALAKQIIEGGDPARERYLRFLSAGKSDLSMNLLRDAGVDLTTPAPIQAALDTFEAYLDEFEKSLAD